jgi:hypothetical protein
MNRFFIVVTLVKYNACGNGNGIPLLDYDIMAYVQYVAPAHP